MPLEHLRPRSADILIDELELKLRTPKLIAHTALGEAIAKMDLSPLVDALRPLIEGAKDVEAFVEALKSNWQSVLLHAARLLVQELAEVAAILVDQEQNAATWRAAKEGREDDEERVDGAYIQSLAFRAWVRGTITLDQAVHIVIEATALGNYVGLGKALLARLSRVKAQTNGSAKEVEPEAITG